MDKVFDARLVCEKYLANWTDVFPLFVHLEKAYDTIDQHVLTCRCSAYM